MVVKISILLQEVDSHRRFIRREPNKPNFLALFYHEVGVEKEAPNSTHTIGNKRTLVVIMHRATHAI